MDSVFFLNKLRWPGRLPIKWALFGLAWLAVCFPHPSLLIQHVRHWRNPNALIEPDAASIKPLIEELTPRLHSDLSAKQTLAVVERFVYEKVPYEWDWNTWGMADYLPTVTEVIEQGQEDCDGRAVVAASLLSHLGFKTQIVSDFAHVWVKTDQGDTMGPGRAKAVVGEGQGIKLHLGALTELPRALAYGIAPFPLMRELILLGVAWLLMLRRRGGAGCNLAAMAFLVAGLLILREGGEDFRHPIVWMQLLGAANLAAGVLSLLVWARINANYAGNRA